MSKILPGVCLLAMACALPSPAALIVDRASLDALLGPAAVTESFELLNAPAGDAVDPDLETLLDSNTVATLNGSYYQGPGLIVPGVQFLSSAQIQWNGTAYFGVPTQSIVSNSDDSSIAIHFSMPVTAFGLDLFAYDGFTDTASVQVLATDQTTVLASFSGMSLASPNAYFFGYSSAGGIGGAIISQSTFPWSPVLDNVEFGLAPVQTPEPATLVLFGLGALLIASAKFLDKRRDCE